MSQLSARSTVRVLGAVLAVVVLGTLLGVSLLRSWSDVAEQRNAVTTQRAGVGYLRSLTALVAALSAAESSAVRGEPADAGRLRSALTEVAAADAMHGALLGTGTPWSGLRPRIAALLDKPGTGAAAYAEFDDVVSLAVALMTRVGAASGLAHDTEPRSSHLTEAGLLLPQALVDAGRAADLAALPPGTDADADRTAAVAVARYQVAVTAARISAALKQDAGSGESPAAGTDLTGEHDDFLDAVDTLTPPAIVRRFGAAVPKGGLGGPATRVAGAALTLADAVWSRLDTLLNRRQADLVERQRLIGAGAAAALACGLLLLWFVLPDRRVRAQELDTDGPEPAEDEPEAPQISMIDARELLSTDELVHVGRAVQAPPRERNHAE